MRHTEEYFVAVTRWVCDECSATETTERRAHTSEELDEMPIRPPEGWHEALFSMQRNVLESVTAQGHRLSFCTPLCARSGIEKRMEASFTERRFTHPSLGVQDLYREGEK